MELFLQPIHFYPGPAAILFLLDEESFNVTITASAVHKLLLTWGRRQKYLTANLLVDNANKLNSGVDRK